MAFGESQRLDPYRPPTRSLDEPEPLAVDRTDYAGFWIRGAALLLDVLLLAVATTLVRFAVDSIAGQPTGAGPFASSGPQAFGAFLSFFLIVAYFSTLESSANQGTLGKMALGLRVTDLYGRRITFNRALGRFFGKILSVASLFLGFVMAGFSERKQALHDLLAKTLVLKAR